MCTQPGSHHEVSKPVYVLCMLLNTSVNRRGMPIVETPAQAIALFKETGLHLLAIGDFIVRKTPAG
jgi:carbamoyltransferase